MEDFISITVHVLVPFTVEKCLSIDLWDPHSNLHDLFGASSSSGYASPESSISSDLWNMESEDEVDDLNLVRNLCKCNVKYQGQLPMQLLPTLLH